MTGQGATTQPNKRMQLTKLRAAPVWQAEVPPCAPDGETDGGTASQLIRRVRRTNRGDRVASDSRVDTSVAHENLGLTPECEL